MTINPKVSRGSHWQIICQWELSLPQTYSPPKGAGCPRTVGPPRARRSVVNHDNKPQSVSWFPLEYFIPMGTVASPDPLAPEGGRLSTVRRASQSPEVGGQPWRDSWPSLSRAEPDSMSVVVILLAIGLLYLLSIMGRWNARQPRQIVGFHRHLRFSHTAPEAHEETRHPSDRDTLTVPRQATGPKSAGSAYPFPPSLPSCALRSERSDPSLGISCR